MTASATRGSSALQLSDDEWATRRALLEATRELLGAGLNGGMAGNLSLRFGQGMLITPSGVHPRAMRAEQMVPVGANGQAEGPCLPSSEWRFHLDLFLARPEAAAIVHTHAPFATALACQRREIPAFHYTVARFGGDQVRCADYATFGTTELSQAVLAAMRGRSACLMANHGALVIGRDLREALDRAAELEQLCQIYWHALQGGEPVLLDAEQMSQVHQRYRSYGQPG
ncbi:MAG: class II aldolase/adducin family protein [Xanthomonadales bacterium]|nr:class II aldolase/adducin family protein [Xanthomonadales bacterium]MCB1611262.1 class II aldolase/adducin family protein [Xanthomonadales bacterium]